MKRPSELVIAYTKDVCDANILTETSNPTNSDGLIVPVVIYLAKFNKDVRNMVVGASLFDRRSVRTVDQSERSQKSPVNITKQIEEDYLKNDVGFERETGKQKAPIRLLRCCSWERYHILQNDSP
jgi:hypothetical protein